MGQNAKTTGRKVDMKHEDWKSVRQECCLSLILFNLYRTYLAKKATEGFGDFKIVIRIVKYTDTLCYWLRKEWCYRARLRG